MTVRRTFTLLFVASLCTACADPPMATAMSSDADAVQETPAFARDLAHIASFAPGTLSGVGAFSAHRLLSQVKPRTLAPIGAATPLFLENCTDQIGWALCQAAFVDLNARSLVTPRTVLPFRYGAPVWSPSPDGHWLLFDRDPRPDVTDYVVTPLTRDTTEVPTFPSTDAEGRPWLGMTWFGEHSVLVWSPRETAMVALDLPTATEIWRLSHTGRQPPSRASTTPDRASVLLWSAVDGNAMLLHLRSGAPPTVTRLDGLLAAGNDECSGLDVPAEELFYGQEEVVPSPTNDGFRVSFGTGYSRVIKTVDLDGRIELLSSCVRRESPFIDDGRFAYEVYPRPGVEARVLVQTVRTKATASVALGAAVKDRSIPPPPLRLSDDGRWIESLFDTGGRVNWFAPADGSASPREAFPAHLGEEGQRANVVVTSAHTEGFMIFSPAPRKKQLERLDYRTGERRVLLPAWDDPSAPTLLLDESAESPVLFLDSVRGPKDGPWTSSRMVLRADGTVVRTFTRESPFEQALGWSGGVLYYLATVSADPARPLVQLHGTTRDGAMDIAIGPPADDVAIVRPDRVLLQVGDDVFLFTPGRYVAEPATGGDRGPLPASTGAEPPPPPSPANAVQAGTAPTASPNRTIFSGSCSAGRPPARSTTAALLSLIPFALLLARRSKSSLRRGCGRGR